MTSFRLASLALLLAPAAGLAQQGQDAEETLLVPGLREPVEVRVDRWGIAHLRARSEEYLFFAQGWNAARDRLFSLELWRRQATGATAGADRRFVRGLRPANG